MLFCHNLIFLVLSSFEFLTFVIICFFEFCHNFLKVLLQFEFLSFVTILVLELCHNLSHWVLSPFECLSFVTIWVIELSQIEGSVLSQFQFCCNSSYWVLFQLNKKISFVHLLSCWILPHFEFLVKQNNKFLIFVTI